MVGESVFPLLSSRERGAVEDEGEQFWIPGTVRGRVSAVIVDGRIRERCVQWESVSWADSSDLALTGNKKAIPILIEAAESLVDRYDPDVGCIRSWNAMRKLDLPDKYRQDNQDEHFLVIIDNMVCIHRSNSHRGGERRQGCVLGGLDHGGVPAVSPADSR